MDDLRVKVYDEDLEVRLDGQPVPTSELAMYTVGNLPSPDPPAVLIYVIDGVSDKHLAVSDGVNWRWPDGSIVD
jgi:hypothetical protein